MSPNVEVLKEGRDFISSWIDAASFEPHEGTGRLGICSITIKGQPYGYTIRTENWNKFKKEAMASLEDDEASAGAAYNNYVKNVSNQESVGLNKVALPDDHQPGDEAPDVPDDDR